MAGVGQRRLLDFDLNAVWSGRGVWRLQSIDFRHAILANARSVNSRGRRFCALCGRSAGVLYPGATNESRSAGGVANGMKPAATWEEELNPQITQLDLCRNQTALASRRQVLDSVLKVQLFA